ncbi:hypothetical protein CW745_04405 [Psychromonas sp. psych-6C06]|uniref:ABC transporter permease n=1 Tax=Psychromonas sp. psych-6C06 TaxID=2058089 RepID=UPI000C32A746|nr:ABC transporter permease [Psychromonas sp. psych-6C06]PKF62671.1 hypothetical protein CW745_04405 [Psychromonas sp. psych-6C06]
MFNDLKYALRLIFKSPGFSGLLLLVMTFGLAISLYIFSFVHALAFKALPFEGGDKIVLLGKEIDGQRFGSSLIDVDVVDIVEQSQSFAESGLIGSYRANVAIDDKTYAHFASSVEPDVFKITNIAPFLGRTFTDQDAVAGAPLVAMISYELWQRYYADGKQALGSLIAVNSEQAKIVGVMAKGYSFPGYTQLWLPIKRELLIRGDDEWWYQTAVAKLKTGISMAAANDDVSKLMKSIAQKFPKTSYGINAYVETFQKEYIGQELMAGMWALIFCALFLLLLTILNVSALLLSKSVEYSRETAMRRALGAPKLRLVMQMTWPSLLLTLVAGGLALLIVTWALQLTNVYFASFDYAGAPYWLDFTLAPFNLYITASVIISVVLLSGVLPGIKASGARFNELLRKSGPGATNYYVVLLSRHLLKVEVGVSAFILTIALLLLVNIQYSSKTDEQYLSDNLYTSMLYLPLKKFDSQSKRSRYIDDLKSKLLALPAVDKVAFSSTLPGTNAWVSRVHARDQTLSGGPIYANSAFIDEDMLTMTNIPLLAGRHFNTGDDQNQPLVAIISQTLADTLWPNEDVIGKTIVLEDFEESPKALIVGLVADIRHGVSFGNLSKLGGVYVPIKQYNYSYYQFALSFQGNADDLLASIEQQMFAVDPEVPQFYSMNYRALLAVYSSSIEFSSRLFTLLGAISLLLAGAGIYGVTVNSVNQKQRDIAIRRSIGASNGQVVKLFLRTTMWDQFIALLVGGIAGTLFCYWKLATFITSPSDMLLNLLGVFVVLFMVIVFAVFTALWKVLKLTPSAHLRAD